MFVYRSACFFGLYSECGYRISCIQLPLYMPRLMNLSITQFFSHVKPTCILLLTCSFLILSILGTSHIQAHACQLLLLFLVSLPAFSSIQQSRSHYLIKMTFQSYRCQTVTQQFSRLNFVYPAVIPCTISYLNHPSCSRMEVWKSITMCTKLFLVLINSSFLLIDC